MDLIIDKPIECIEQDKLGRTNFAESLANMLLKTHKKDGFVVLLNGEWGCGKTSIINLTKKKIEEIYKADESLEYIPIIQDFAPWNVVSQDGIIHQFFDVLSSSFAKTKIKNILSKIQKSKVFQNIFKSLNYIPVLKNNSAWVAVNSLKNKFDKYVDSFEDNKNLQKTKEEIIETLKNSWTRHIVFIDDLDRLNDNEIKLVIQLIKSVCNFPNVIYVISADYNIIQSALKNEQSFNENGDRYIEKIVQVVFDVPNVKHDKIVQIAIEDLNKILGNITPKEAESFQLFLYDGLLDSIKTIRDEKKFINLIEVSIEAYQNELDLVDYIAITYLKFINQKIIQLLADYSDYLFNYYYCNNEIAKSVENEFKKKLDDITNDEAVYNIIKRLFPQMFCSSTYIDNELYLSTKIGNKNRFNLYLTQQLDVDDFSEVKFQNVISTKSYEDLIKFAESLSNQQTRKLFLSLVSLVDKTKNINDCDYIVRFFMENSVNNIPMKEKLFSCSKDLYARDCIKEISKKYGSTKAYEYLKKHLNSNSDIYILSEFAIELNLKDGEKYDYGFTDEQKAFITSEVGGLIIEKLTNKTLCVPNKTRALRFLYQYYFDKFKEWISTLSNNEKVLLICDMMWVGSMTDRKEHLTYSYSLDWIENLFGKDSYNTLISSEFNALSEKQKQRIIVLKMQMNRFVSSHIEEKTCYLAEDITRYCQNNNIDFEGNDELENS